MPVKIALHSRHKNFICVDSVESFKSFTINATAVVPAPITDIASYKNEKPSLVVSVFTEV